TFRRGDRAPAHAQGVDARPGAPVPALRRPAPEPGRGPAGRAGRAAALRRRRAPGVGAPAPVLPGRDRAAGGAGPRGARRPVPRPGGGGRPRLPGHARRGHPARRAGDGELPPGGNRAGAAATVGLRRAPRGRTDDAAPLRELLQRELRFEESGMQSALGPSDVYEAAGLLDLSALSELATRAGGTEGAARPELDYAELTARDPFVGARSVFGVLDHGDVLVHHPYDSFEASFERFIAEAAEDPDVAAIKLTLYRPGGPSRIGELLRRAAAAGKD